MFPGMGGVGGRGMNPAKMKQMMKQMGIDVKELQGCSGSNHKDCRL